MGMQGHFAGLLWASTSGPSGAFGATSPHGGEELDFLFRTGRRLGGPVLRRWVRLGKGSARLSLGRGAQPAGAWASLCCVPGVVLIPNAVAVKTFCCFWVLTGSCAGLPT